MTLVGQRGTPHRPSATHTQVDYPVIGLQHQLTTTRSRAPVQDASTPTNGTSAETGVSKEVSSSKGVEPSEMPSEDDVETKMEEFVLGSADFGRSLRAALTGCCLGYYTGTNIPDDLLEQIFLLTKDNMQQLYNDSGSGWTWDDKKKRIELKAPNMRYFIVDSKIVPNDVMIKEACRNKLQQMVDKVERDLTRKQSDTRSGKSRRGRKVNVKERKRGRPARGGRRAARVVGFIAFGLSPQHQTPHTYIHELQVREDMRGRRLGSYLLDQVAKVTTLLKLKLMMLTALKNNQSAVRFYQKKGFLVDEASPDPCYDIVSSKHDIMSKVMEEDILKHVCTICAEAPSQSKPYKFRFEDSLIRHRCHHHGAKFPFVCTIPGCSGGVVRPYQLEKHRQLKHGIARKRTRSHRSKGRRKASRAVAANRICAVQTESGESKAAADQVASPVVKVVPKKRKINKEWNLAMCFQKHQLRKKGELVTKLQLPSPSKAPDPDWLLAMELQKAETRKSGRTRRPTR